MSNEVIEFKDDAGMPVKFTSQDIRERLCPNATESELALCIELCNRQHLNPFTKEVYLVKYRDAPASIITSYQVFNRRANRQESYGGIKSGGIQIPMRYVHSYEVCDIRDVVDSVELLYWYVKDAQI